jgi:hypothetical protein
MSSREPQSFREFYAFYLSHHSRAGTRLFHFLGTMMFLALAVKGLVRGRPLFLIYGAFIAYAFAWLSHFVFERNRPATFRFPLYSLVADFVMFFELLIGRLRFDESSESERPSR